MPYTLPRPQPHAQDGTGTAGLRVTTFAGPSPVIEIHGEIDIFSAPELRDELLRVIRRYGPQLALDLAGVTFIDCAGVNMLLATRRRAGLEDGSVDVIRASPRTAGDLAAGPELGLRAAVARRRAAVTSAGWPPR
jgi:anti-sigma B factor antagonist